MLFESIAAVSLVIAGVKSVEIVSARRRMKQQNMTATAPPQVADVNLTTATPPNITATAGPRFDGTPAES